MLGKSTLDISCLGEINPFSFRYSNFMVYYLLGAMLPEVNVKRRFSVFLMFFGLLGLMFIKYFEDATFLWQGINVTSGYYRISTILISCGAFLLVRQCSIETNKILAWYARTVGSSTMGIFYLHMPLIFLLRSTLFAQYSVYHGWLLNLIESLIITFIAYAITWAGKKIPFIQQLF